ncbi:MAG: MAPEG family protein [Gammaproteobacteria bacterium]|nr:MAPEG family protein [Gammaproteobacteria bacterium]
MNLQLPLYTALTAAVLLALQLGLMMSVGSRRLALKQGIGDGGNHALALAVRRHGNLAENAAIFVAALTLLELLAGRSTVVATLGAAFVTARIAHAIGLSMGDGPNVPRFIGAMGTVGCGLACAGMLAWTARGLL